MSTFSFVTLNLRNPPMESEKIVTYVAYVVLTNARIDFGGRTLPYFYRGQETIILGKIFDKILNWRLTIPQREGMWENQRVSVNH